jgi:1-acyl-sn-glycerol-3-phosphate acyltransferase
MASVLDGYDADFVRRAGRFLSPILRVYFRFELRGAERMPPSPVLIVANHSALGMAELLCFIATFPRVFGLDRKFRGLMMDMFLKWPGMMGFWKKVGAVPASPANGRTALAAGCDVLVFPGGDIDTCRPFYQPRHVHFGARRGYIRLALEQGVPIVPLATIGSHWTWLMAPGGGLLARLLCLKRLARIERVPIAFAWLIILMSFVALLEGWISPLADALIVALALLPNPVRITSEFLPPIDVAARTAHLEGDARIEAAHELVYGTLADAVRRMQHGRPLEPVLATVAAQDSG